MNKIRKIFKEVTYPNYYIRYDELHKADFYLGLDKQSRISLKLRGSFKHINVKSTQAIEVMQFKSDRYNTIIFSLLDNDLKEVFYNFCLDIIEFTREVDLDLTYKQSITRFELWKKMFNKGYLQKLSLGEIMGLIGELLFLMRFMNSNNGQSQAIASWTGNTFAKKDFALDDVWYEVKTKTNSKNTIKISSIEQLEGSEVGFLIVYSLEKTSLGANAISLNQIVTNIREIIDDIMDLNRFEIKLFEYGYSYNEDYEYDKFLVREVMYYKVDHNFPIIKRNQIPNAVEKCQYELNLNKIDEFIIEEEKLWN